MGVWTRTTATSPNWQLGHVLLGRFTAGQTFLRAHFRWGVVADTSIDIDYYSVYQNIISLGLVTTVGDGTETPPDARLQSGDQAPPTQRWVYWETRSMRPNDLAPSTGSVGWVDTGSTEETSTKGQVKATGLPAGQTLNLWASWSSTFAWDPTGSAMVWLGASVLND